MEHWIIPCNVRVFNVIDHFERNDTVVWKNSFTIQRGDIVYIYVGAPYGEIKYKCHVISDSVDEETLARNAYAIPAKPSNNFYSKKIKYIVLQKDGRFPDKALSLDKLRENGLGQVQIQARTDRRLQAFIDTVENRVPLISDPQKKEQADA